MTTKAETREDTIERLSKALDQAFDHLRSYKARQDRVVLGLADVRRAIEAQKYAEAAVLMDSLLSSDLKQAKKRVEDRTFALKIAADALMAIPNLPGKDITYQGDVHARCDEDLVKIRKLAPEAFGEMADKEEGAMS